MILIILFYACTCWGSPVWAFGNSVGFLLLFWELLKARFPQKVSMNFYLKSSHKKLVLKSFSEGELSRKSQISRKIFPWSHNNFRHCKIIQVSPQRKFVTENLSEKAFRISKPSKSSKSFEKYSNNVPGYLSVFLQ
jgi:hypothetical protein